MRLIGFILVLFGVLALGYQEFAPVTHENVAEGGQTMSGREHTIRVPPVVGGIAVVSGLLLVATDSRRADN